MTIIPARCSWCDSSDLYRQYHDEEWGIPLKDDDSLFRLLMLEGQQAGLAWITVLNKREHMDRVFFGFNPQRLARATEATVDKWATDPGVIRHRGKLNALITNARCRLEIPSFSAWLWSFAAGPDASKPDAVPAQTLQSQAMSKALKKAGFRFVGPTICYAFMQSAGMINDHHPNCWRYEECDELVNKALLHR